MNIHIYLFHNIVKKRVNIFITFKVRKFRMDSSFFLKKMKKRNRTINIKFIFFFYYLGAHEKRSHIAAYIKWVYTCTRSYLHIIIDAHIFVYISRSKQALELYIYDYIWECFCHFHGAVFMVAYARI